MTTIVETELCTHEWLAARHAAEAQRRLARIERLCARYTAGDDMALRALDVEGARLTRDADTWRKREEIAAIECECNS